MIGLTGDEYAGIGRDILVSVCVAFATLILLVYPTERPPSERLKQAAIISLVVLVIGALIAKRRLNVVASVAAIVGFRGIFAVLRGGIWQGLLIMIIAFTVVLLCIRYSPGDKTGDRRGVS
jgi:nitric oxide reductase large subunit